MYFNADTARGWRDWADLFIANNVLAHQADPLDFLEGVKTVLKVGGRALIEVQYLGDLVAGNQFDHFYHQHRYYFTLRGLRHLARKAGLNVLDYIHTPAQGGSIRVVLGNGSPAEMPDEGWLLKAETFYGLADRAAYVKRALRGLLREHEGTVAGFAAPAKATTLLSYCGIGPALDHIVDLTPEKQGKYLCGVPVVAPGDRPAPDTWLLLAWNYLGSILRREKGRFIVPLPVPTLL